MAHPFLDHDRFQGSMDGRALQCVGETGRYQVRLCCLVLDFRQSFARHYHGAAAYLQGVPDQYGHLTEGLSPCPLVHGLVRVDQSMGHDTFLRQDLSPS